MRSILSKSYFFARIYLRNPGFHELHIWPLVLTGVICKMKKLTYLTNRHFHRIIAVI